MLDLRQVRACLHQVIVLNYPTCGRTHRGSEKRLRRCDTIGAERTRRALNWHFRPDFCKIIVQAGHYVHNRTDFVTPPQGESICLPSLVPYSGVHSGVVTVFLDPTRPYTDFVTPTSLSDTDYVEPGHRFCHTLAPIMSNLGTDYVTSLSSIALDAIRLPDPVNCNLYNFIKGSLDKTLH